MTFRSIAKILCASFLVSPLLLFAVATGQDAEPPRGVIGMVRQLNDKSVQRELKLTDKQMDEAKKIAELLAKIRDGKAQSQAKRQLTASLTAKQFNRLKQIHWQRLNGYALLEPEVSAALMITEEQKKELVGAQAMNVAEHNKMLDFLRRARFRSREALEQFKAKYRTAASQRLRSVLTPKPLLRPTPIVASKLLSSETPFGS